MDSVTSEHLEPNVIAVLTECSRTLPDTLRLRQLKWSLPQRTTCFSSRSLTTVWALLGGEPPATGCGTLLSGH